MRKLHYYMNKYLGLVVEWKFFVDTYVSANFEE